MSDYVSYVPMGGIHHKKRRVGRPRKHELEMEMEMPRRRRVGRPRKHMGRGFESAGLIEGGLIEGGRRRIYKDDEGEFRNKTAHVKSYAYPARPLSKWNEYVKKHYNEVRDLPLRERLGALAVMAREDNVIGENTFHAKRYK